ncbi:MAG: hypothetical protein NC120_02970 [Ruminococcus sp.]|nr:hypothetical protein [Ruminococcus sp.]
MEKTRRGISIAREIILIITFCLSIANVVLMIVQFALNHSRGTVKINDRDEMPF